MVKQTILPRLVRRFASAGGRGDLLNCARILKAAPSDEHRKILLGGFEEAYKGRALPTLPEPLLEALAQTGMASRHLRVRLREPEAIREALKIASDETARQEERLLCVRLFGEVKVTESAPMLIRQAVSAKTVELRKAALTSLLIYEDQTIGEEIASNYLTLPPEAQPTAQTLLTSRPGWCVAFLKLIQSGAVKPSTVPPSIATLLREHDDKTVAALAQNIFSPAAPAGNSQHSGEYNRVRGVLASGSGNPYKGEPIFLQRCGACHMLFFKGGRIGPDLTAYQRDDLGTLLTSILDPNAEIREGYVNQIVTTTDGRTLTGFVTDQDPAVLVLRGLDGQDVSISRNEVRELKRAPTSLMPEGLLGGLSDQELRDFFAYLRISQPITR